MHIKNEYTVSEIAEIFQTEPETVRKWIKGNKLSATKGNSNKEGMRVSEASLQKFLSENSVKYSKTAFITATAAILTGGTSIAASLIIKANRDRRNLSEAKIKSSDMIYLLEEELKQELETVSEKKDLLDSLMKEIDEKNERISFIKEMITELEEVESTKRHSELDEYSSNSFNGKSRTTGKVSGSSKTQLSKKRIEKKTVSIEDDTIAKNKIRTSKADDSVQLIQKKELTVGGVSGSRKMRLGRVHKKKIPGSDELIEENKQQ